MPPPMPVPTVTQSRWSSPLPAPKRNSPHAAALASFSTTTGSPTRAATASRSGSLRQARLGANSSVEQVLDRLRPHLTDSGDRLAHRTDLALGRSSGEVLMVEPGPGPVLYGGKQPRGLFAGRPDGLGHGVRHRLGSGVNATTSRPS